jgi:hypothetical protein
MVAKTTTNFAERALARLISKKSLSQGAATTTIEPSGATGPQIAN